jgi:hypothetical protein
MNFRISTKSFILLILSFTSIFIALPARAIIDDDAKVVYVRDGSCIEGGVLLNNCFKNINDLQNWIVNTRDNNAGALVAEIGPGYYLSGFACYGMSDVSLKGAGPDKTIIGQGDPSIIPDNYNFFGISASSCDNFHVQDLSIKANWAINWDGPGTSTWTNVHVEAHGTYGWRETCATITSRPKHFWFNSTIKGMSDTKVTYSVACSENWFFGSEITNQSVGAVGGIRAIQVRKNVGAQYANNTPEVHVYGSVIRVVVPDGVDNLNTIPGSSGDGHGIYAVGAGLDAEIHIHGTGIDVIGNNVGNNVAALVVADGGMIHAAQSSFVLKTGPGGITHRILNGGGIVMAPYLWEKEVLNRPLQSSNGSDMVVENVCPTSSPGCTEAEKIPHMMIYKLECNANGPWWDTTMNTCRQ